MLPHTCDEKTELLILAIRQNLDNLEALLKSKYADTTTATATTATSTQHPKNVNVEWVKQLFASDIAELLSFEDHPEYVKVTPRKYLGSLYFADVATTIKNAGGEYISAGRDSHFRISKGEN